MPEEKEERYLSTINQEIRFAQATIDVLEEERNNIQKYPTSSDTDKFVMYVGPYSFRDKTEKECKEICAWNSYNSYFENLLKLIRDNGLMAYNEDDLYRLKAVIYHCGVRVFDTHIALLIKSIFDVVGKTD